MGHESPAVEPEELQQILLHVYSRENCSALYDGWSDVATFTEDMICVGLGEDGLGVCQVSVKEVLQGSESFIFRMKGSAIQSARSVEEHEIPEHFKVCQVSRGGGVLDQCPWGGQGPVTLNLVGFGWWCHCYSRLIIKTVVVVVVFVAAPHASLLESGFHESLLVLMIFVSVHVDRLQLRITSCCHRRRLPRTVDTTRSASTVYSGQAWFILTQTNNDRTWSVTDWCNLPLGDNWESGISGL